MDHGNNRRNTLLDSQYRTIIIGLGIAIIIFSPKIIHADTWTGTYVANGVAPYYQLNAPIPAGYSSPIYFECSDPSHGNIDVTATNFYSWTNNPIGGTETTINPSAGYANGALATTTYGSNVFKFLWTTQGNQIYTLQFNHADWSYNCNNGENLTLTTSNPLSPIINTVFPANNQYVQPFDKIVIGGNNLTSTDNYHVFTSYYIPQVSPTYNIYTNDVTGDQIQNTGITANFGIPDPNYLQAGTSTAIYITQELYDWTLGGYLVASNTQIFYLYYPTASSTYWTVTANGTSSANYSTSSQLNPYYSVPNNDVSATTTAACSQWNTPSSGIFDIGNGMLYAGCQLINIVFVPSKTFSTALQNAINGFQGIFPFNLYFSIVGGVQSDLYTNATSTPTTTLTLSTMGLHGEQLNLINVSSTFLASALTTATQTSPFGGTISECDTTCATEKVNNAYLPIKIGVWIIAGIKIVAMITTAI